MLFREEDVVEETFSAEEAISWLSSLSDDEHKCVLHHIYVSEDGKVVWCKSTCAFVNHSKAAPNHFLEAGSSLLEGQKSGAWIASRDIKAGDELLYDYAAFGDDEDPESFQAMFTAHGEIYPSTKWLNELEAVKRELLL